MKMILVLDEKPDGCFKCPCSNVIDGKCYICEVTGKTGTDGGKVIDGCPLRPMPERCKELDILKAPTVASYAQGWNECLDAITGEDI